MAKIKKRNVGGRPDDRDKPPKPRVIKKKNNRYFFAFLTSLILYVFSGTAWLYVDFPIYHIGASQMMLTCAILINRFSVEGFQKTVSNVFVFICLNGLLDELFFDPTSIDVNEYITSIIVILWVVWKNLRR